MNKQEIGALELLAAQVKKPGSVSTLARYIRTTMNVRPENVLQASALAYRTGLSRSEIYNRVLAVGFETFRKTLTETEDDELFNFDRTDLIEILKTAKAVGLADHVGE